MAHLMHEGWTRTRRVLAFGPGLESGEAANRARQLPEARRHIGDASALSAIVFLLGLWLGAAPSVLDYSAHVLQVSADAYLVATAVTALGLYRALMPHSMPWLSGVNALLGVWLVLTPALLDYSWHDAPRASWNDVVVGVAVVVLATASMRATRLARPGLRTTRVGE